MRCSVIAKVVIDKTVYRYDKPFDYSVPPQLEASCRAGCRVLVPFGRANAKRQGMVLECSKCESCPPSLKAVLAVTDAQPVLTPEFIEIVKWLKEYTFCTYFDAIKSVIPYGLGKKIISSLSLCPNVTCAALSELSPEGSAVVAALRKKGGSCEKAAIMRVLGLADDAPVFRELLDKQIVTEDGALKQNMRDPTVNMVRLTEEEPELSTLTPKQRDVVQLLQEVPAASVKEVTYFTGVTSSVITALVKKNVAEIFPMPFARNAASGDVSQPIPPALVLTDEQNRAFDGLCREFDATVAKTALLYGVTGSGKTSVFLKLVDYALAQGKSAMVMVPEISLTPQTLTKFRTRYGDKISVFHSAMSMGQRMEEWKRTADGTARVAIGTRSAVFAPLQNLGLIIMDEEQEHTYKSEQSPRFHARDLAKFRCKQHNALLFLASATPSVESYSLALGGKYALYTLNNRYGNAVLPEVETVDMRAELAAGNTGLFSRRMTEAIDAVLSDHKQAILLLNRRGHNTYVSCPACGTVMNCPNCSISLTFHSANHRLMCHYCGASTPVPDACPTCKNSKLRFSGAGTQKAGEELTALFPKARILRLDADTTMTRDAFANGLEAFANGAYDIMLGTQMVAKGLDFPNVTLVGVLSADQSMYSDDFRAYERTFSLLTQVIGRSGRGDAHGIAMVQTTEPDSEIIAAACAQAYTRFYESEILTRKVMIYPPYCDIVMLGVTGLTMQQAKRAAGQAFAAIKAALEEDKTGTRLIILGPTPATVPKVNGKFRQRIIIKTKNNMAFRGLLRNALERFYSACEKTVQIFVDINPESMI